MKHPRNKRALKRRTFLLGAGSVAIGLPFLEEMKMGNVAELAGPSRASAAPGDPPPRLVTLFFGLGLDPSWQNDFSGPLEPYLPFRDKMAVCSVDIGQGNAGGAHCNTSTVVFVGEQQTSVNVAGGPSIDQLVRREVDPSGATLASGLWWRRGACDAQALRVFNPDGSARMPIKRPSEVFDRLFGSYMPPSMDGISEEERRRLRVQRSVLDTVLDQYDSLRSDRSYLGVASKRKLEQHLTSIREIEARLAPAEEVIEGGEFAACSLPDAPRDPDIADYDRFSYGTGAGAPALTTAEVESVFHLHAELWAAGLRCDLVRFGNLMFESAGGHTNLQGTYSAMGDTTDFPGDSQHDTYFHGNQPQNARLYQHFAQTNLAYFLSLLDDGDYLEANGKTVLDNSVVLIGTEYGWNHSKNDVFHAVVGGDGRFNAGFHTDRTLNGIDLYNAVAQGFGVDARVGSRSGVESEGDASFLLA